MYIPIFGSKEIEALRVENKRLADKANTLEVQLSVRGRSIDEMRVALRNAEEIADSHEQQIGKLKEIIREKDAEIADLKSRLVEKCIRPCNERGAGRKRKATSEQVQLILSLKMEGKSYRHIASVLSAKYGGNWNKSTVRNAHLSAKN